MVIPFLTMIATILIQKGGEKDDEKIVSSIQKGAADSQQSAENRTAGP